MHLTTDLEGRPQWTAEATTDDEIRALLNAVESCRFTTQRQIAEVLGWDTAKVSRMKARAIREGKITDRHWEFCLKEAAGGDSKEDF